MKEEKLSVKKEFTVGKQKLFRAWTEESSLKQWWKPMNKSLERTENDIRPGGTVAYYFEDDIKIHGKYKEAIATEKLVYTWNWEMPGESHHKGEYLLTVIFRGDEERSEIEVVQENFRSEQSVQPHREGWEEGLQALKEHVEG